jgi:hypothetical protein
LDTVKAAGFTISRSDDPNVFVDEDAKADELEWMSADHVALRRLILIPSNLALVEAVRVPLPAKKKKLIKAVSAESNGDDDHAAASYAWRIVDPQVLELHKVVNAWCGKKAKAQAVVEDAAPAVSPAAVAR